MHEHFIELIKTDLWNDEYSHVIGTELNDKDDELPPGDFLIEAKFGEDY